MIWAYVGAGALVAGLAGGWCARDVKADADDKNRIELAAKDAARRAEHADTAAQGYEIVKANDEVRERIVTKEVIRVVQKPVYRNECVDADGLRILAADIAARTTTGQPAPTVRAAPAAH